MGKTKLGAGTRAVRTSADPTPTLLLTLYRPPLHSFWVDFYAMIAAQSKQMFEEEKKSERGKRNENRKKLQGRSERGEINIQTFAAKGRKWAS